MLLPEFAEAVHYRELRGGRFRFELMDDVVISVPCLASHTASVSFRDVIRREWARIEGDTLTIRAGYRWNGASPKRWIPIIGWIGTPDPSASRLATAVHDVCFQFLRTADWPIHFEDCNDLFEDIMRASGFRLSGIYHAFVKRFGAHFCGEFPERGEHSVIL